MMKKIIIIFPVLFLLLACEKPVIENPEPEVGLYEQVWETRFHPDTYVHHTNPHIYKDEIISAQINSFNKKLDYNIVGYNKFSGEKEWTWNHPDPSTIILDTYGHENYLFIRAWHSIFMFDIISQSILWEYQYDDNLKNIGTPDFIENSFYLGTVSRNSVTGSRISSLRKYDISSGEFQILYTEEEGQIKAFWPSVGRLTKITLVDGKDVGIFEIRYLSNDFSPRETLPDLVCIDLETYEITWRQTDYNEMASHANTIKYHNGKLYNTGDWSLYAFDPETGEELNRWQFWESHPLGSFNNCDFTIVDDVVYTLDDLGHLNGVNTLTGWSEFPYQKGAARTTSPPTVRNDLILYSSLGHESIEIFDTKKKAFVHKEREKSFGNVIVYDEETDVYFTTTDEIIHGFRIHDE